jgi:putative transposase
LVFKASALVASLQHIGYQFCIDAFEEAIDNYGIPEIFNTDQGARLRGSQFTSDDFTNVLKENDIRISMDGKGRWIDNVFVE